MVDAPSSKVSRNSMMCTIIAVQTEEQEFSRNVVLTVALPSTMVLNVFDVINCSPRPSIFPVLASDFPLRTPILMSTMAAK